MRKVSKSKTGKPWLNLPIEENKSKANTSPPASRATWLKNHRTTEQYTKFTDETRKKIIKTPKLPPFSPSRRPIGLIKLNDAFQRNTLIADENRLVGGRRRQTWRVGKSLFRRIDGSFRFWEGYDKRLRSIPSGNKFRASKRIRVWEFERGKSGKGKLGRRFDTGRSLAQRQHYPIDHENWWVFLFYFIFWNLFNGFFFFFLELIIFLNILFVFYNKIQLYNRGWK